MPKLTKRSDGRFDAVYKGHHFYGKTQSEALRKRKAYIDQIENGMRITGISVEEYANHWLPVHKASVSDKCYADYAVQLNKLIGAIGQLDIRDVKPSDAKAVFNLFLKMSESTIHRARMLYVALFDSAIADGYIHQNPFRSTTAKPHKGTSGTHRTITQQERQLIQKTPHRFRAGAMVMLYAGLRRGEAIALNIDNDIDFDQKVIHVNHAVRYDSNAPISTAPKTEAGTRDVPLLDVLFNLLMWENGYLMQSAHGQQLTETAFRRGWDSYMTALSSAAGHPVSIRCHDLRHSYCTMLRDLGIDMHLAMKWMGHSDEKMILRIYDHVEQQRIDKAIKTVENSMKNSE